jgi:hypothetical protein
MIFCVVIPCGIVRGFNISEEYTASNFTPEEV